MKDLPHPPLGDRSIPSAGNPKTKDAEPVSANGKTSERKRQANRENAAKSTGPRDTSSTRFNALRHGLRATKGITELDDADAYQTIVRNLLEKGPQAARTKLAENIALELIRLERNALLEAEYLTAKLHPAVLEPGPDTRALSESFKGFDNTIVEQGFNPELDIQVAEQLAEVYQRSRTSSINSLLRLMNMFKRLERMTNGEQVPAPLAADISLNIEEPSRSKSTTLDLERRDEQMSSLEGQHSSSRLANRSVGSPHTGGEGQVRTNDDNPSRELRNSEQPTASSVETEIDAIPVAEDSISTSSKASVQKDDLSWGATVDGTVLPNEANALKVSNTWESPLGDAGTNGGAKLGVDGSRTGLEVHSAAATPMTHQETTELPNEANPQTRRAS